MRFRTEPMERKGPDGMEQRVKSSMSSLHGGPQVCAANSSTTEMAFAWDGMIPAQIFPWGSIFGK